MEESKPTDSNDTLKNLQNIMQMMEQAKALSAMFQQTQAVQSPPPVSEPAPTPTPAQPQQSAAIQATDIRAEFDAALESPGIRAIKAAIPHLEPRYRRNMGMFVIFMEMQKLMEDYGGKFAGERGSAWRRDMLESILPFLDEERRRMARVLLHCMEIAELMNISEEEGDDDRI